MRFQIQQNNNSEIIKKSADYLKSGRLVIIPTDTIYGIAADPHAQGAENRLFIAKGRSKNKPIPLLVADVPSIERFGVVFTDTEKRLAEKFWPGSLTMILKVNEKFEGFRIPDCHITLELLKAVGGILRVTSANISGESPAISAIEAEQSLGKFVSMVLDVGIISGGIPSTVVKVESEKVTIIREGAISAKTIDEFATVN